MASKIEHGRGKCVSRSTYQKTCEENKRLQADIYSLVMMPLTRHSVSLLKKWRDKFIADQQLAEMLHEFAVQYVKDNPDSVVAQIAKEFPVSKK